MREALKMLAANLAGDPRNLTREQLEDKLRFAQMILAALIADEQNAAP